MDDDRFESECGSEVLPACCCWFGFLDGDSSRPYLEDDDTPDDEGNIATELGSGEVISFSDAFEGRFFPNGLEKGALNRLRPLLDPLGEDELLGE